MKKLKPIIVVGCGGHSRFVISAAINAGFSIYGVIDTAQKFNNHEKIMGLNIIGNLDSLHDLFEQGYQNIVIGIGDNKKRAELYYLLSEKGFYFPNVIHPSSVIDSSAKLGNCNIIGPNTVIGSEVKIGSNNIINTGSIIEHQSVINDHCHISLSSVIAGKVRIGNKVFIGANSTVIDKIKISNNTMIGAGTTVINDILKEGLLIVGSKPRVIEK